MGFIWKIPGYRGFKMKLCKYNKRGFSTIETILTVIMIVAIAFLGIKLYEIYQQKKAEKAVVEVLEAFKGDEIENFNAIVKANCGTIQTLIQVELADSGYETVKDYIFNTGEKNIFRDAGIHNPTTGLAQNQYGLPDDKGCVVVTYDNETEIFYINGNGYNNESVLKEPLIARY
jgi:hypothetical protein